MTKTFKHLIENKIDNVKRAVEIAKKMAGNMTGAEKKLKKSKRVCQIIYELRMH